MRFLHFGFCGAICLWLHNDKGGEIFTAIPVPILNKRHCLCLHRSLESYFWGVLM